MREKGNGHVPTQRSGLCTATTRSICVEASPWASEVILGSGLNPVRGFHQRSSTGLKVSRTIFVKPSEIVGKNHKGANRGTERVPMSSSFAMRFAKRVSQCEL